MMQLSQVIALSVWSCTAALMLMGGAAAIRLNTQAATPLPLGLPQTELENRAGNGDSSSPFFSGDGRYLFFQSTADDLVQSDASSKTLDLFRYEPISERLQRISREPVSSGHGGDWVSPVASKDGDVVVFTSTSTALVSSKTNSAVRDVFWMRISSGEIRLISHSPDGLSAGDQSSYHPVMSEDGRWVAFETEASNLVPSDNVSLPIGTLRKVVCLWDAETGQLNSPSLPAKQGLISIQARAPSLSKDGKRLAFYTESANGLNQGSIIHVHDTTLGSNIWTFQTPAFQGAGYSHVEISPDGQRVAFYRPDTRPNVSLNVFSLETQTLLTQPSPKAPSTPFRWNASSTKIAFEEISQINVWDLTSNSLLNFPLQTDSSSLADTYPSDLIWNSDDSALMFRYAERVPSDSRSRQTPLLYQQRIAEPTRSIISTRPDGSPANQSDIAAPTASANGRWVAFESTDTDAVAGDRNLRMDVLITEIESGKTILVSRRHETHQNLANPAQVLPAASFTSKTGILAFSATDLSIVVSDTNKTADLFLQDLSSGKIEAVTLQRGTFTNRYHQFLEPQLSKTGTEVAFIRHSVSSLPGNSVPLTPELHFFSRQRNEWRAITTAQQPFSVEQGNPNPAFSLSANGQWIAFQSSPNGGNHHIFVHDVAGNTNRPMDVTPQGKLSQGSSTSPCISADGQFVFFLSTSTDLVPNGLGVQAKGLFVRDQKSGTTKLLSDPASLNGSGKFMTVDSYTVSSDGQWVAFRFSDVSGPSVNGSFIVSVQDPNRTMAFAGVQKIYSFSQDGRYALGHILGTLNSYASLARITLDTGKIESFYIGRSPGFWNFSFTFNTPIISGDGRYILFASPDDSLVEGDSNGVTDVFVRDMEQRTSLLASRAQGALNSGNGASSRAVLSTDGKSALFRTWATDVAPQYYHGTGRFILIEFSGADSDLDGLPDDWEMAYFSTLNRDGTGDFDGDETTDADEYRSGTNPINGQSYLRILPIISPEQGVYRLMWAAVPGRSYRVESLDTISGAEWKILSERIVVRSSTGEITIQNPGEQSQRYYRVSSLE